MGLSDHNLVYIHRKVSIPRRKAKVIRTRQFKVSISWLGILHIYNTCNPVIRIAIYLVVRKFYLRGLFGC